MASVNWGASHQYDDGITPSVASNDGGLVVEVHQSQNNDGLWYHVGQLDASNKTVAWGDSHEYDDGATPSVAMTSGGLVVEVHRSQNNDGLWYRVGQADGPSRTIAWGDSHQYDPGGQYPYVAINGSGLVVEVHQTTKTEGVDFPVTYTYCWYRVGKVDATARTIAWGDSDQFLSNGQDSSPAIALTEDGSVVAVHVYQPPAVGDPLALSYQVGRVNAETRTIAFTTSTVYDTGMDPSVSINRSGTIIEVHSSPTKTGLWYHVGQLDASALTVSWSGSKQYDDGDTPWASIDASGNVVEVHQSQNNDGLWYHVGRLM
jgi:hypothetical protein